MQPTARDRVAELAAGISDSGRRIGQDEETTLPDLLALAGEVDAATIEAVTWMRIRGRSWQHIAELVGISKQAAIMRWSKRIDADFVAKYRSRLTG